MRPFKSSERINKNRDGAKQDYCNFVTFKRIVIKKTSIIKLDQIYKILFRKVSKPIIVF